MDVFHYCAEQLKDKDLFTSCSNRDLLAGIQGEEGAVFNHFDTDMSLLLHQDDFTDFQMDDPPEEIITSDSEQHVDQNEIDHLFLLADENDHSRYEIDSIYFDSETSIDNPSYLHKLFKIMESYWDELDIYADHIKR